GATRSITRPRRRPGKRRGKAAEPDIIGHAWSRSLPRWGATPISRAGAADTGTAWRSTARVRRRCRWRAAAARRARPPERASSSRRIAARDRTHDRLADERWPIERNATMTPNSVRVLTIAAALSAFAWMQPAQAAGPCAALAADGKGHFGYAVAHP